MTNVTDMLIHDNLIIVDTDGDLITVFTESNRDIMEDDSNDDYDHSTHSSHHSHQLRHQPTSNRLKSY